MTNEVACDYNAGFSGALAALISLAGTSSIPSNPPTEPVGTEFDVLVSINSQSAGYTEFKIVVQQMTGWPARRIPLSYRFYVDFSDVAAMGFSNGIPPHIAITTAYMQGSPSISALTLFSGNTYYVEISWPATTAPYPGGQSQYQAETQASAFFIIFSFLLLILFFLLLLFFSFSRFLLPLPRKYHFCRPC